MVNDMLFLSQADRGARCAARRAHQPGGAGGAGGGVPRGRRRGCWLAAHRGRCAGRRSTSRWSSARSPTCCPTRSASARAAPRWCCASRRRRGSSRVEVENAGETIAPQHLPRLFDRFSRRRRALLRRPRRPGPSRPRLAIVAAAIARMTAGRPLAESRLPGRTRRFHAKRRPEHHGERRRRTHAGPTTGRPGARTARSTRP